ncbi:MAG: glycosyltransferase family 39 protein, partial [Candidatus Binataceae bacterium]
MVLLGLAIRLYLSATSYCLSGDGVAYIGMAREFAAGEPRRALASVFSPLYPAIIAIIHPAIPSWEAAGNLVSTVLGTAAIVTVFGMTRAIFNRRDLALGAAALMAVHPDMAAYAASVRTEAGFIMLMTAAVWLLIISLAQLRLMIAAAAGLAGGAAFLYRTEALGLLIFASAFIPAGAMLWRRWRFGWALIASAVFAAAFLALAAPYLILLHTITGRWSVGREFTAAMNFGIGDVSANQAAWHRMGLSAV